jgi:group I intron endonuclease
MYYIVYKTINKINGKYYIGKHETETLSDGYLGSGLLLKKAIKKYGHENFSREILYVFDNKNEMEAKEREIITESMISDSSCYNIAIGGQGGNLGPMVNKKIGKTMSKLLKGKSKTNKHIQAIKDSKIGYKPSSDTVINMTVSSRKYWEDLSPEERQKKQARIGDKNGFFGKKHSEATKEKIRSTIGNSRQGCNHPQAKTITIDGVTYATRKECMIALGLNKRSFYKLLGEKEWQS